MSSEAEEDRIFKALADSRRRAMLDLLRDGPQTTGELCAAFADRLDRCTVMQHLGVLEAAGLVLAVRRGRQRFNYLNAAPIAEIRDRWISPLARNATDLLMRLKQDMESGV